MTTPKAMNIDELPPLDCSGYYACVDMSDREHWQIASDNDPDFLLDVATARKMLTWLEFANGLTPPSPPIASESAKERLLRVAMLYSDADQSDGLSDSSSMDLEFELHEAVKEYRAERKATPTPTAPESHVASEFEPRYSGDASRAFWKAINDCEDCHKPGGPYEWGVRLQNVEEAALRVIRRAVNAGEPTPAPAAPGELPMWVDDAVAECRASIEAGLDHSLHNAPGRVAVARAALDRMERIIKRVDPVIAYPPPPQVDWEKVREEMLQRLQWMMTQTGCIYDSYDTVDILLAALKGAE